MKKTINPELASLMFEIGVAKIDKDLEDYFAKLPEDPNGVTLTLEQVREALEVHIDSFRKTLESWFGELPEVPMEPPLEVPVIPQPIVKTEIGRYHGRHKINNRPVWYFSKRLEDYPKDFTLTIEGCGVLNVKGNTGKRIDYDENFNVTGYNQSRNRTFIRQSLVVTDPRGLVVVGSAKCKAKVCRMEVVTSELAPPPSPTTPDNSATYNTVDTVHHLRFIHNKPFTWLPKTGRKYGGQVKFVWPELGVVFIVPDATDNYSPRGHGHETYFCGTKNKPEESNGDRASIFGPAGKYATYVEVHYSK